MQSISILSIKSSSFHGQQKPYLAALYMYLEIFWKQFTGDRSVSNATNTSLHHSLKEYVKNGEGGRQVEERCRQAWGSGCRAEDKPHCKKNHDNKKKRAYIREKRGKMPLPLFRSREPECAIQLHALLHRLIHFSPGWTTQKKSIRSMSVHTPEPTFCKTQHISHWVNHYDPRE